MELTLELIVFLSLAVKYTKKKILFFNSSIADLFSLPNSIHLLHEVI